MDYYSRGGSPLKYGNQLSWSSPKQNLILIQSVTAYQPTQVDNLEFVLNRL